MKRILLVVATVFAFLVGGVLTAALLLWLSVGGTFFRGQTFGLGTAIGMAVLASVCAVFLYTGFRALRASRRA